MAKQGFSNFLEDMSPKPSPDHTLDRINGDEGYSPDNCRWLTRKDQAKNRKKPSSNKSGATGVFYLNKGKYGSFRAEWYEVNGKSRSKSFSIKKYGYDEAYRLACEYRELMISRLNEQGAGYSENHGK